MNCSHSAIVQKNKAHFGQNLRVDSSHGEKYKSWAEVHLMKRLAVCLICVFLLVGCGSYYKVTDPASKSVYYTTDIQETKGGAIKFKDAKSGSDVTLQSSEVKEIGSAEFDTGTKHEKK
jgi:hypothetical protein